MGPAPVIVPVLSVHMGAGDMGLASHLCCQPASGPCREAGPTHRNKAALSSSRDGGPVLSHLLTSVCRHLSPHGERKAPGSPFPGASCTSSHLPKWGPRATRSCRGGWDSRGLGCHDWIRQITKGTHCPKQDEKREPGPEAWSLSPRRLCCGWDSELAGRLCRGPTGSAQPRATACGATATGAGGMGDVGPRAACA